MVEAGKMKEKDVVMLCISARQICKLCCPKEASLFLKTLEVKISGD